jgi:hypothetical protein
MTNSRSVPSDQTCVQDRVFPIYAAPEFGMVSPVFRDADIWLYRERTIALLRRYLRISIEVGRLPSLLGRELFRSKVTSYRMSSFEDGVIFVSRRRTCYRTGERIFPATHRHGRLPGLYAR